MADDMMYGGGTNAFDESTGQPKRPAPGDAPMSGGNMRNPFGPTTGVWTSPKLDAKSNERFVSDLNTRGMLDQGSGFDRNFGIGKAPQDVIAELNRVASSKSQGERDALGWNWSDSDIGKEWAGSPPPTDTIKPAVMPPPATQNPLDRIAQRVSGNPTATAPYTNPIYLPSGQVMGGEESSVPLLSGSDDNIIAQNIQTLKQQGYPESRAIAMAYRNAGKL